MIKHILFDLDGTLLPMDQDYFTKYYFKFLAKKVAPLGFEPKKLIASIWQGTKAMALNDGSQTNEDAFWKEFTSIFGDWVLNHKDVFEDFYRNEFNLAQESCGFNPLANTAVQLCKEKGFDVYLATNPIFPRTGTLNRIRWAGLNADDFKVITTYEDCYHCKPNPEYFNDICKQFNLDPKECLMIGNDAIEDTAASKIGMEIFLITDTLENKHNVDISCYRQGSFEDLISYLNSL